MIIQKKLAKAFRYFTTYVRVKRTGDWFDFYKNVLLEVPFLGEYGITKAFAGPSDFISYLTLKRTKAKKKVQWNHFDVNKVNYPNFGNKFYLHFDQVLSVSEKGRISR